MKILIMTDLEGPSGVNGRPASGVGNQIINPEVAQKALVSEVNACCEGLVAAGADEIHVWDGHGGSNSIDIFALHPVAELIQCGDEMHTQIYDADYDAFVQIGAHAMQQSGGFMCHSFNSHATTALLLNGEPIGEIGVGSYLMACFGVPTILVSGDEAACAEARALLGDGLPTVATKYAYSRYSVRNYSVIRVAAALRAQSAEALGSLASIPLVRPPTPVELVYHLMCPNQADLLEIRGGERVDVQTVRYCGDNFAEVWLRRLFAPGAYARVIGKKPCPVR